MRRGEIYYADLSPTVGSKVSKPRPVLIVSNDANNRAASTLTVLPITSNASRVYPFEVLLSPKAGGLSKPSKAQAQQIRTTSKERLRGNPLGRLNPALMRKAEDAMRLHLDLYAGRTRRGVRKTLLIMPRAAGRNSNVWRLQAA